MEKKLSGELEQIQAGFERQAPLRGMFQDEARFGRISDCRRCWWRSPLRPLVRKMISRQYTYVFGAVSVLDGQLDTLVLPQANSECMQLFLDEVARRHSQDNIVMVLDGAGWHTAHELIAPPNLRLLLLPPYSPELNPVEHLWDELGEKHFHNRVFASLDAVEQHLVQALGAFERDTERIKSICAWPWIINSVSNAN
jgi:transposase